MSLVSGPGKGGGAISGSLPHEMTLAIDQHVQYIQNLDSVRGEGKQEQLNIDFETEERRAGVLVD